MDLLPWSCSIQIFVTLEVAQAKEMNYHDWHPIDQIFTFVIKVLGYLHKQTNVFLNDYVSVVRSLKELNDLPLSIFVTYSVK
jgi:hypothetical protein